MTDQATVDIELRRVWTETQKTVEAIAETSENILARIIDSNRLISVHKRWLYTIESRLDAIEKLLDEIAKKAG